MSNLILMFLISLFAVALCIGWWPRNGKERVDPEPENSHPGRVLPPGVPITRAMKDAAGGLSEPQPLDPAGSARLKLRALQERLRIPSYVPLKTSSSPVPPGEVRRSSVGRWVRHKTTGELLHLVSSGGLWLAPRNRNGWVDVPDTAFDLALPRLGEWWLKKPCPKGHLPSETFWSPDAEKWEYTSGHYTPERCGAAKPHWAVLFALEREACLCGCLVPVGFGLGEAGRETRER